MRGAAGAPPSLRPEDPIPRVAEPGLDEPCAFSPRSSAAIVIGMSGSIARTASRPSGAASSATRRRSRAPTSRSRVSAALAEPPVASIGSTTNTTESATPSGSDS